tara:strand:- start:3430 stop:5262 length:1833 start_codon:yes stop_codon:yes gene_type:complete
MSDLKKILQEEYKKKEDVILSPQALVKMIEEAMGSLDPNKLPLLETKRRGRAFRLPPLVPTEISVGQQPSTDDSSLFREWMSKIGLAEPTESTKSEIALKLKAITDFFADPEKSMEGLPVAQTLSFLMFLDQFLFIIREFNPSVAGFLWEPLMASLFGRGAEFESRQIPTGEHDIADIRVNIAGQENSPVSLKVLREKGTVEGSFNDLAMHFANYPADSAKPANMRYVVAIKSTSGKRGNKVSAVTFYEFDITHKSFFDWVGHEAYEEKIELTGVKFIPAKNEKFTWLRVGGSETELDKRTGMSHPKIDINGSYLWIRTGKVLRGSPVPTWIRIAKKATWRDARKLGIESKDYPLMGQFIPDEGAFNSDLNLRLNGQPPVEGEPFDMSARWEAKISKTAPGGVGGFKVASNFELMPGGASNEERRRIWGDEVEQGYWVNLAATDPAAFWKLVTQTKEEEVMKKDKTKMETVRYGPPGFRNREQFTISPAYYMNRANTIGTLSVSDYTVRKSFEAGARNIGEDMTNMFNAMAELSDNIGRFFLTDCGGGQEQPKKCGKRDHKKKEHNGREAVKNAGILKQTVDTSIGGIEEQAAEPERPQAMGGSQAPADT